MCIRDRLDVDQFPDGILLELRLGLAFGVCLQRGKHCCLCLLYTSKGELWQNAALGKIGLIVFQENLGFYVLAEVPMLSLIHI